jgi:hypothetical protein
VDAFLRAAAHAEGLHAITTATGRLEVRVPGHAPSRQGAGATAMVVAFSEDADAPTVLSWGGPEAGTPGRPGIVVLPARDDGLPGGGRWLQPEVATLLAGIAAREGRELLLVGAGEAGFAALYFGCVLGPKASTLALNPDFDFLPSTATDLRRYAASVLPGLDVAGHHGDSLRDRVAGELHRLGADHSVVPLVDSARQAPRRLICLLDAADRCVARRSARFLDAAGFRPAGNGFFLSDRFDGLAWFGDFGAKSGAASRLLAHAAWHLVATPARASEFMDVVLHGSLSANVQSTRAPRDLREAASGLALRANAASDGAHLLMDARVEGLEGHEQVEFAFYVHAGRERVAMRWYEPAPSWRIRERPDAAATRVEAFARDAFGHHLGNARSPVRRLADSASAGTRTSAAPHVQIFGSCVSRDAFELVRHDLFVSGYIARSSIASAFDTHRPPARFEERLGRIRSAFQRRMVQRDLRRLAPLLLREADYDALLLDLVDERFPLLDANGALVTLSHEFRQMEYGFDPATAVEPGSQRHMEAWIRGVGGLVEATAGRMVIVNCVHWADRDDAGDLLPDQPAIQRSNALLDWMYDHLRCSTDFRFIDYDERLLVADRKHKWGASPFHYVRPMYEHTVAELDRLLG